MLSQEEIDKLLTDISNQEVDATAWSSSRETRKVRIYDYRKPSRFSRENIHILKEIHNVFASSFCNSLSEQLNTFTGVHIASINQMTYEEIIRSVPNLSVFIQTILEPLQGLALIEIGPSIAYSMLMHIFGNGDITEEEIKNVSKTPLSDIEASILEGQAVRMLGCLREAWSNVIDLRPTMATIESNPKACQITTKQEMCIVVTLEVLIGEQKGMMNIIYPDSSLRGIRKKLIYVQGYGYESV